MKFSTTLIVFALACLPFLSQAQDNYSIQDKMEITYRAEQTVAELKNLFNFLASPDIGDLEFNMISEMAYSNTGGNQLFANEKAIIENDLDPDKLNPNSNPGDLEVSSYLQNLSTFYEAGDGETISFENVKVSKIYEENHPFTMVSFESTFNGRHKVKQKSYRTTRRIAYFRFHKEDDKWKTVISSIVYQEPSMQFEEAKYKEQYLEELGATDRVGVLSAEDSTEITSIGKEYLDQFFASLERKDKQQEKQKKNASLNLMKEGDLAFEEQDFETALIAYRRAQDLTPYEIDPFLKINAARRAQKAMKDELMQKERRFKDFAKKGAYNFRIRQYEDAINYYRRAQNVRPEVDSIAERLRQITKVSLEKKKSETKIRQNDLSGAIRDLNQAIKSNSSNPDLYVSRATVQEKLGKSKKAIDDYGLAINHYDEYLYAYLRRGNLYELTGNQASAELDFERAVSLKPDSTDLYIHLSKIRQRLGNHAGAIKDYNTAVKQRPTDGKLYLDRGMLYLKVNDRASAYDDFSDALTLTPSLAQAWFQRGKLNVANQAIPDAANDFQRAKKEGLDAQSWNEVINYAIKYYNLGTQDYQNKKLDDALVKFTHAVTLHPEYAEAWYQRGKIREDKQEQILAMNDYGEAIKVKSNYSDAFFRRGSVRFARKDYIGAASDFGDAATHKPDYIDAHIMHGRALNNNDDWDGAILAYKQALNYNSKRSDVYFEMGLIFLKKEQNLNAQTEFSKAIRYQKNFAQAYYHRGLAQYNQKVYKSAIKDFDNALRYQSSYKDAYYSRGKAYMDLKKAKNALPDFRRAIDLKIRPLAEAYQNLGKAYFALQQYPQAVTAWEKALDQNGNSVSTSLYLGLGEACTHTRAYDKAKMYFEEILAFDSKNPQAHYGLAGCYAGKNLNSEALEHLEIALQSGRYSAINLKKNPFFKILKKDPGYKALINNL
ncbi:MAG: tetratricopeptide repeat protein [Bacteroidota bacterium]